MLKDFVKTQEWQEIQIMFFEEMDKMNKTISYNEKDVSEVGKHYIARQEAIKIIKTVLRRIETVTKEVKQVNQSYK